MNVFELFAKLGLDTSEYDQGLQSAESKASKFGGALKSGLGTAAKLTGAAIAGASTATVALTKSAVSSYAEFQQLEGGIETLFGEDAITVMNNANKAFKTSGMSVNDYMETAINSAAALTNSLDGDTAESARLMDQSIIDMADNVNRMGTSMESVQNAYRGFSRGNFTINNLMSVA